MKKIYYEKVGNKYVPCAEYDSDLLDSLPRGAHLIMVTPGVKSTRCHVNPNYAAMIAACYTAEDAICEAIHKASEAKPKERPITERQRRAWEEMKDAFGDEFFSLTYGSIRDYVEAGSRAMQKEAELLMKNPSVRKAYEHFLLVCELTKDE